MKKKLKICLIEFDLSSFGGRHIEFVDGFMDTFKKLGHTVKIMGYWNNKLLQSKEELVAKSMSKLDVNDIIIKDLSELGWRGSPSPSVVEFLNKQDFILSVAHHSRLWRYINVPIVYWIIAKPTLNIMLNLGLPNPNTYIWTETQHQQEEIRIPNARVMHTPLDYSMFRRKAKSWKRRKIDLLLVTGVTKWKVNKYILDKELKYIDRVSKKMGLKTVGLFTCRKDRQYEWDIINNLSFETHINISRREVPKFMGNAKIFFHPSPLECAALVHYEALNAGCYPIVRAAGSAEEQLGNVGIIFNELPNMGFWQWLKEDILLMDYDLKWSQRQGMKFDRRTNMRRLEKLIREVLESKKNGE